ncbi:hypothetical protein HFP57_17600 [Parasphingopyxis algicola]|uniref:hypothetical protein n=1 Tax=Parasphingopyxis algicola TaxID=2026624 RepID=UPI0015A17132|nr:hypothetical protein [Parasphingopyxis algicola]QLC26670.1 hypothetical protein HFP57_17600 [Parasphingopyxis algicola]
MRDELDHRIWDAHHDAACDAVARISQDCARGLTNAREMLLRKIRSAGFHSAVMIAALVVSGSTIFATVTPIAGI